MECTYDIVMHVPIGRRCGKLRLCCDGGSVSGLIDVLGRREMLDGTLGEDGRLLLHGSMRSMLRRFEFTAEGQINGDELELDVCGDRYSFRLTGVRSDEPTDTEAGTETEIETYTETNINTDTETERGEIQL